MLTNHNIELLVNNQMVDVFEEGLSLRLSTVLADPEKIRFTQSSYSFTFELPTSPKNNLIFDFANVKEKRHKFNKRYEAHAYVDGVLIFTGLLKIDSITNDAYNCNLYEPKVSTLDSIFGDQKMNEFNWYVPYTGVSTINQVNNDLSTKYFFPLISYGLFQKTPSETSGSGYKKYTDKYQIDKTNKFYFNSFIPSLNMVELMKRIADTKGYTLAGDILTDDILNDVYLSNYINENQDPLYNYGNPAMGEISMDIAFKNYSGTSMATYCQSYNLQFIPEEPTFDNFSKVSVYNLLDTKINNSRGTYLTISNVQNNSRMLTNGGIQIPSDGWYEISADVTLKVPQQTYSGISTVIDSSGTTSATTLSFTLENFPVEFQLLKWDADDGSIDNLNHNLAYYGTFPNESTNISSVFNDSNETTTTTTGTTRPSGGSVGRGEYTPTSSTVKGTPITYTNTNTPNNNPTVVTAVDPYNNPNYICGFQMAKYAIGQGYRKNGYSWSPDYISQTRNKYICQAYYQKSGTTYTQTEDVNKNTLGGASNSKTVNLGSSELSSSGKVQCVIYLHKNDILQPFAQTREYNLQKTSPTPYPREYIQRYKFESNVKLKIRALAPDTVLESKLQYGKQSYFDYDLNLANFCHNNQKVSEFFTNVQKLFNLDITTNTHNKVITINKQKIQQSKQIPPINLDKQLSDALSESQAIDYPSSITLKWKEIEDSEGLYRTALSVLTEEELQKNDWNQNPKIDKGYTVFNISPSEDATPQEETLGFVYNYILPWKLYNGTTTKTINIPTLAKTEWFIENSYNYEEYSKYDSRSLGQFIFTREAPSTDTLSVQGETEEYIITIPNQDNLTLKEDGTIITNFYSFTNINSKNDGEEVECYISPIQYNQLLNGARVQYNDDIYTVVKINGYDPTNNNPTKLLLIQD